jgi:hypothetical protein
VACWLCRHAAPGSGTSSAVGARCACDALDSSNSAVTTAGDRRHLGSEWVASGPTRVALLVETEDEIVHRALMPSRIATISSRGMLAGVCRAEAPSREMRTPTTRKGSQGPQPCGQVALCVHSPDRHTFAPRGRTIWIRWKQRLLSRRCHGRSPPTCCCSSSERGLSEQWQAGRIWRTAPATPQRWPESPCRLPPGPARTRAPCGPRRGCRRDRRAGPAPGASRAWRGGASAGR